MAYVGLAKPAVATLKDETAKTYTDAFYCGKAMQIDVSPQYAEGSLYGDNTKAEYDKEFKYADVTLQTTTLPIKAHNLMFGHTVTETEGKQAVKFKDSDDAPYVGLGFIVTEKVDGKRKYVASWLYKVKFAEGSETYKTKGDNIEYQTPNISGQAMALPDGDWKDVEMFDTEAEAVTWLEEKAGKAA